MVVPFRCRRKLGRANRPALPSPPDVASQLWSVNRTCEPSDRLTVLVLFLPQLHQTSGSLWLIDSWTVRPGEEGVSTFLRCPVGCVPAVRCACRLALVAIDV